MSWNFQALEREAMQHHDSKMLDSKSTKRSVWRVSPKLPALVLGSSQSKDLINEKALNADGVDLVSRHSGGGVVYLDPKKYLWLDVVIPADDPLYSQDVSKASLWLGQLWCSVLQGFGIDATLYKGKYIKGPKNGLVCFASRAAGEAMSGSAKVVGISQRRTKYGIWYQTLLLLEWQPGLFLKYLNLDYVESQALEKELTSAAKPLNLDANLGINLDPERITEAFLSHISAL